MPPSCQASSPDSVLTRAPAAPLISVRPCSCGHVAEVTAHSTQRTSCIPMGGWARLDRTGRILDAEQTVWISLPLRSRARRVQHWGLAWQRVERLGSAGRLARPCIRVAWLSLPRARARFVTRKANVPLYRQCCSLGCSSLPFDLVQPSTHLLAELRRERS
jgi:hypothetical protein